MEDIRPSQLQKEDPLLNRAEVLVTKDMEKAEVLHVGFALVSTAIGQPLGIAGP